MNKAAKQILIVDYDSVREFHFSRLKSVFEESLCGSIRGIEHVGS